MYIEAIIKKTKIPRVEIWKGDARVGNFRVTNLHEIDKMLKEWGFRRRKRWMPCSYGYTSEIRRNERLK